MGRKIGYRYRCSRGKCQIRVTLPKRAEEYAREPKCKGCGSPLWYDRYRNEEELAPDKVCECDGYHFPHRKGGGVWCVLHPTGPTEDDFVARYGPSCLEN